MKEFKNTQSAGPQETDGPFGMDRVVTDSGTTFFRNRNGIFDESGKKVFISMAQLRRFEANEKTRGEARGRKD